MLSHLSRLEWMGLRPGGSPVRRRHCTRAAAARLPRVLRLVFVGTSGGLHVGSGVTDSSWAMVVSARAIASSVGQGSGQDPMRADGPGLRNPTEELLCARRASYGLRATT